MLTGDFFFLRPQWLSLIVLLVVFFIMLLRKTEQNQDSVWYEIIDSHLLKHLRVNQEGKSKPKALLVALFVALLACIIAMAGPTWEKNKFPAFKTSEPVAIVMSLAQSMNTQDISPNRMTRAGHKVSDMLNRLSGTDVGFVIYSDRPFTAAPLTSDTRLIKEMLPELTPDLMPVLGDRLDLAIDHASTLLKHTGAQNGQIVVLTNSAGEQVEKSIEAAERAFSAGFTVNILGIGTIEGGELITASGQLILDQNNQSITSMLELDELIEIAKAGSGQLVTLTADDNDIDSILNVDSIFNSNLSNPDSTKTYDDWIDMGYWLLLIPVLLAPLAFKRGLIMSLPLCFVITSMIQSSNSQASVWDDLWQTRDQQAAHAFESEQYSKAAEKFQNQNWKAGALYKAGRYGDAATEYDNLTSSDSDFNQGNALAKSGDLENAIKSYDKALAINPDDKDAQFNRDLVASILQQQTQDKQNQENKQNQTGNEKQQGENNNQENAGTENDQSGSSDQQSSKAATAQPGQSNQKGQSGSQNQTSENQQAEQGQSRNDQAADSGNQQDRQAQSDTTSKNTHHQQAEDEIGQNQSESQASTQSNQPVSQASQTNMNKNETIDPESNAMQTGQDDSSTQYADSKQSESTLEQTKSVLKKTMDKILSGNKSQQSTDPEQLVSANMQENEIEQQASLNQSAEQLLRTVPDNSSGLLRARIKQHYRQYSNGN